MDIVVKGEGTAWLTRLTASHDVEALLQLLHSVQERERGAAVNGAEAALRRL